MDIIILLLCTFLIVNRLMKILGQYDPEQDKKRYEKNTVIIDLMKQKYNNTVNEKIIHPEVISPTEIALPDHIRTIINDIKIQDKDFDIDQFIRRAEKAYAISVNAMSDNDIETLNNLLDKDLIAKLAIQSSMKTKVNSITEATLSDAALFGDRAILTVHFKYNVISFSEDNNGNIISGSKDKIQNRESLVSFCQYLAQEKVWKITKIVNKV